MFGVFRYARLRPLAGYHQAPESTAEKAFDFDLYNSRQSSTVDTSIPFCARHFEHSTEYSTRIPCRQTATWLADSLDFEASLATTAPSAPHRIRPPFLCAPDSLELRASFNMPDSFELRAGCGR
eukprot:3333450-Pyramimonas_sp.AAC.2